MNPIGWLRETRSIFLLGFRNAIVRPMLPAIVIIGFIAVVLVMVSVLSIGHGLSNTFTNSGSQDVAIALTSGAFAEGVSHLSEADIQALGSEPGVAPGIQGPVVSPELITTVEVPKRGSGVVSNVVLRGVTADAFQVHPKVHVVDGRMFISGVHEVIVGRQAVREYRDMSLGSKIHSGSNTWTVVGIFASGGSIHESEIWTDAEGLQTAFHIGNSYSSAYIKLTSPSAYKAFAAAVNKDPRLNVQVEAEKSYYSKFGSGAGQIINSAGMAIAILMALGAIIGAINLMYTHLAARNKEMATLRAVGFRRMSVLSAVLLEGLVFGLIGGVIGGAVAYLVFDGYQAGTIAGAVTQVDFQFAVTTGLLIAGIVFALFMGFIGGLFPAIRAARLPVAKALRET
ncbi:MAG TPA: ABC transporter permease [Gammaproteobacteria bacterium]|nr:ABC transporter permease [Gammaproteobacteria bacterium]